MGIVFFFLMSFFVFLAPANAQAPCATSQRLVKTDFFDFGAAGDANIGITTISNQFGWTGSGTNLVSANTSNTAFFENEVIQTMTQAVSNANLKGNGATVAIRIAVSDFTPRTSSNGALFSIAYGGTVYCTITNPATPDTDPENATVVYGNGAVGPGGVTSNTVTVTASSTVTYNDITIILPSSIPNSGNLVLTFNSIGGNDDFRVQSVSFLGCPIIYSGTVYSDGNGLNNGSIDGTGTNLSGTLLVGLFDAGGNQVASVPVASDGTYSLAYSGSGNYTLRLIGLPATYTNTGEKTGTEPSPGDGTPNGITSVVAIIDASTNTDKTGNNFGINSQPQSASLTNNVTGAPIVGVPVDLSSVPLAGSDPEDQATTGSWATRTLIITSLPTNGFTLTYNGTPITTPNTTIANYDPTLLSITPTAGTPVGTTTTSFGYSTVDGAGNQDLSPATYTVNFATGLPVVFGDIKAVLNNNDLIVDWTTVSENNNDHFEIEVSENGADFLP
ncbi:hypothetical protein [Niabella hibiscisoli]|uniref:hypothetical protein n=1 Tax=Niabella hibiscisoli TaxID=1825928 RepID=UPI001F0E74C6|nr:hypothetical protein [Niabella hibiscisoli]MCH5720379.1 hypothetical protein [Niabella hibiscisoli]